MRLLWQSLLWREDLRKDHAFYFLQRVMFFSVIDAEHDILYVLPLQQY